MNSLKNNKSRSYYFFSGVVYVLIGATLLGLNLLVLDDGTLHLRMNSIQSDENPILFYGRLIFVVILSSVFVISGLWYMFRGNDSDTREKDEQFKHD